MKMNFSTFSTVLNLSNDSALLHPQLLMHLKLVLYNLSARIISSQADQPRPKQGAAYSGARIGH
jgi:hypothetical protein